MPVATAPAIDLSFGNSIGEDVLHVLFHAVTYFANCVELCGKMQGTMQDRVLAPRLLMRNSCQLSMWPTHTQVGVSTPHHSAQHLLREEARHA